MMLLIGNVKSVATDPGLIELRQVNTRIFYELII